MKNVENTAPHGRRQGHFPLGIEVLGAETLRIKEPGDRMRITRTATEEQMWALILK